jgi:hypothetical protein
MLGFGRLTLDAYTPILTAAVVSLLLVLSSCAMEDSDR